MQWVGWSLLTTSLPPHLVWTSRCQVCSLDQSHAFLTFTPSFIITFLALMGIAAFGMLEAQSPEGRIKVAGFHGSLPIWWTVVISIGHL